MRQTTALPAPRLSPCARGLCRLSPVPAGRWPFPTLSLRPLCRCSDPYPAALLGCACPLLDRGHRPHPTGNGFGARIYPHMAASVGSRISWLQSFDYLRAPALARPPGCSDRGACAPGRQAFHTTHRPAGYPDRDVASLHARHGRLAWLDFHQLGRSLVGCSLPHTALRHRSPTGMRRPSGHLAAEAVYAELVHPLMIEAGDPVAAGESVLDAGEDREAFVDVGVDLVELLPGVTVAEVVAPPAGSRG